AVLFGWALHVGGCASALPADPSPSPDPEGKSSAHAGNPAEACLVLSEKMWDRDVLESLRLLRKGAALRDAECCRRYLAHAEAEPTSLSQRTYARLFVEGQLRTGPLRTRSGEDIRGELYYQ